MLKFTRFRLLTGYTFTHAFCVFIMVLILHVVFPFSQLQAQNSLPFTENWESGSFETNGWTVSGSSGHCTLINEGLNSNWSLALSLPDELSVGDSVAVETPWLDATGIGNELLVFRFDYKLLNADSTRWPLLRVYADAGSGWKKLYELTYDASLDWRELKADLSMAKGHQVRLMWVAMKETVNAEGQWFVDNIVLQVPAATTVFNLSGTAVNQPDDYKVDLRWGKPGVNPLSGSFADSVLNYYVYIDLIIFTMYQYTGTGIGIFFDNRPYKGTLLSEARFYYNQEGGFTGRASYRVQLMNFETRELVGTYGPFTTTYERGWQRVPLNLAPMPEVDSLAVLIEPLTEWTVIGKGNCNMPGVGFRVDYHLNYRHSVGISLYDDSYKFISDLGELLFELSLLTPDGKQVTVDPASYAVTRWQQSLPINYVLIAAVDSAVNQWSDSDVTKGSYSYFVTAGYPDGSSLNSDTVAIEMPSGLGIGAANTKWPAVVPNPVNGKVLHLSNAEMVASATITDLAGRRLAMVTNPRLIASGIALPTLATGHYLLQLTLTNGQVMSRKFTIN